MNESPKPDFSSVELRRSAKLRRPLNVQQAVMSLMAESEKLIVGAKDEAA